MKNTIPYHNTNHASGAELSHAIAVNETDDSIVLKYLRDRSYQGFTGDEIHSGLIALGIFGKKKPITSIRRALNSLMNKGKVYKSEAMKLSDQDRMAHLWRAYGKQEQSKMNFS